MKVGGVIAGAGTLGAGPHEAGSPLRKMPSGNSDFCV